MSRTISCVHGVGVSRTCEECEYEAIQNGNPTHVRTIAMDMLEVMAHLGGYIKGSEKLFMYRREES